MRAHGAWVARARLPGSTLAVDAVHLDEVTKHQKMTPRGVRDVKEALSELHSIFSGIGAEAACTELSARARVLCERPHASDSVWVGHERRCVGRWPIWPIFDFFIFRG